MVDALARPQTAAYQDGTAMRDTRTHAIREGDEETARSDEIARFLAAAGWADCAIEPLASDASFRRYHRVRGVRGGALVMDLPAQAPPPQNDLRPYLRIATILRDLDLSAPEILAADLEAGLALIEDFGDDTYNRILARGGDETALYGLAVDTLIALHERYRPQPHIARFEEARALAEVELVLDWYLPAVSGHSIEESARAEFRAAWSSAFSIAAFVPESLALFDYHIDNLMLLPGRSGTKACGLLDFQDALHAPIVFDLVSLIEDARRDVDPELGGRLIVRYLDAFPSLEAERFSAAYALIGAQRNTRILGTFARLDRRDGKPAYLDHIPRVWRWLDGDLRHPGLHRLADWFGRHLPTELRIAPKASKGAP